MRSCAIHVGEGLTWMGFGLCPSGVDGDVMADYMRRRYGPATGPDEARPSPEPPPGVPLSSAERAAWDALEVRLRQGSRSGERFE